MIDKTMEDMLFCLDWSYYIRNDFKILIYTNNSRLDLAGNVNLRVCGMENEKINYFKLGYFYQ